MVYTNRSLREKKWRACLKRGQHYASKETQIQETRENHSRTSMHGINGKFIRDEWYCVSSLS